MMQEVSVAKTYIVSLVRFQFRKYSNLLTHP